MYFYSVRKLTSTQALVEKQSSLPASILKLPGAANAIFGTPNPGHGSPLASMGNGNPSLASIILELASAYQYRASDTHLTQPKPTISMNKGVKKAYAIVMKHSAKKAEVSLSCDKGIKIIAMIWETNGIKMTPVTIYQLGVFLINFINK